MIRSGFPIIALALLSPPASAQDQDATPARPAESGAAAAAEHFSLDLPASEDPPPPVTLNAPPPAPAGDPAVPDADAPPAASDAPAPAPVADPATTGAEAPIPDSTSDFSLSPSATPSTPFSLDTPIADLIADPRAKAVLDKDLPGLSDDSNLARFEGMSLRQFQPQTGGQLTDALLQSTGDDLAAIPPTEKPRTRDLQTGR